MSARRTWTATAAACWLGYTGMASAFTTGLARVQVAFFDHAAPLSFSTRSAASRGEAATAAVRQLKMVAVEPSLKVVTDRPITEPTTDGLARVFQNVAHSTEAAFIPYLTAGYPKKADTVDLLLALQEGGADIVELGIPFTDPQADGPTIQATNQVALKNKVSLKDCLDYVRKARAMGLTTPVILMGYLNPFLAFGLDDLMHEARTAGADGFIVVDLLPDNAHDFIMKCRANQLAFVPLVAPTTTDDRLPYVASAADSFIYCVSVTGVTGARDRLPDDLTDFVSRVRSATDKSLCVGFGISTPDQVGSVAEIADGVVVGSAVMNSIDEVAADAPAWLIAAHLKKFMAGLKAGVGRSTKSLPRTGRQRMPYLGKDVPKGYFGEFGGQYIPELLVEALRTLEVEYEDAKADPEFQEEFSRYRKQYIGGPTPMYHATRLSAEMGGAQIWLKREELAHTGAHHINNAVGQALLAKRIGKKRIIAETGAGQHGVATATVCALLGMECIIYMGEVDCERQKLNVSRMQMLGAKVVPVHSGGQTLKDAMNEAMRDLVTNVRDTYYIVGSAIGPHPFPTIVRDFQSVIGKESRSQMLELAGNLPDHVVACVGGGSNAIGMFHPFMDDVDAGSVHLLGVEAGGRGTDSHNSATLTHGTPGVLHGARTYLLQDSNGQISDTQSIAVGLDYPGVGPEHSWLKDSGRAQYITVTDAQALEAIQLLARNEGLISALEPAHAVYAAMQLAKTLSEDKIVLVNLCGSGEKDMHTVSRRLGDEDA